MTDPNKVYRWCQACYADTEYTDLMCRRRILVWDALPGKIGFGVCSGKQSFQPYPLYGSRDHDWTPGEFIHGWRMVRGVPHNHPDISHHTMKGTPENARVIYIHPDLWPPTT